MNKAIINKDWLDEQIENVTKSIESAKELQNGQKHPLLDAYEATRTAYIIVREHLEPAGNQISDVLKDILEYIDVNEHSFSSPFELEKMRKYINNQINGITADNQISDVEQLADEYSKYERKSKWGEVVRSAFKAGYRAALQSKGDDREVYVLATKEEMKGGRGGLIPTPVGILKKVKLSEL